MPRSDRAGLSCAPGHPRGRAWPTEGSQVLLDKWLLDGQVEGQSDKKCLQSGQAEGE